LTQDEALRVAMDWYGSGNQDPDEFEKLITAIAAQRTWVGLTDEDCDEVERWVEFKEEGSGRVPNLKLIRYIEAKLREKNERTI
jgi:hypothetical protein